MAYLVALGCLGTALVVLLDGEVDLNMGGFRDRVQFGARKGKRLGRSRGAERAD